MTSCILAFARSGSKRPVRPISFELADADTTHGGAHVEVDDPQLVAQVGAARERAAGADAGVQRDGLDRPALPVRRVKGHEIVPSGIIHHAFVTARSEVPDRDNLCLRRRFLLLRFPIGTMSKDLPASTPAELGASLRQVRKSRGLRLEDVALAAGVGVRFISELERGKPTARLAETLRVAAALGVRVSLEDARA